MCLFIHYLPIKTNHIAYFYYNTQNQNRTTVKIVVLRILFIC